MAAMVGLRTFFAFEVVAVIRNC